MPWQWFEAEIEVPELSYVLNMVMTNPDRSTWDNNNSHDYNISIEGGPVSDADWDAAIEVRFHAIRRERAEKEAAEQQAREERAAARAIVREESKAVMRKKLMHVLYTEPAQPIAGQPCTVHYNPMNTNLDFAEEVWIRMGYNRWTHADPPPPLMMQPTLGEHHVATFDVPADAHLVDMVFSSGGGDDEWVQYDNAGGLDYHFPTQGATTQPQRLHVMHIAVEMAPIAKVGGLGDVVTSLSRAVQDLGHTVEIILPKYGFLSSSPLMNNMEWDCRFEWGGCEHNVYTQIVEDVRCFFIDSQNNMFNNSNSVYEGGNDGARFDFFCKAALEFMLSTARQPDIIHCHDWSTAMAAKFLWEDYHNAGLWKPRVAFTIHNLEFGQAKIGDAMYNAQVYGNPMSRPFLPLFALTLP